MIAPTPLEPSKKQQKFIAEINSKKYNISFILNDSSILINLEDKNEFIQKKYEQSFLYDSICKISKIFKIYDNINEIYENLIGFMEKKKYSLEIKDSSVLLLFNLDVGNFAFELFIKKSNIEDSLNVLTEKMKYLIEENKEIKSNIKLLIDENKELKNKIIYLENKINENEKNNELFKESSLIQNIEEKTLIANWILPNTKIITQMIYKAKRDGDKASDFHAKCDNMGPTLVIIQTTTGYRFGGYTSKSWTRPSSSNWPGDSLAFIFSLNLKRKFEIKKPKEAIGHYNNNGPVFGYGHAIDISSECLHNSNSYHDSSGSYEGINDKILTNERNFVVSDYEVFQIKFQ